ncbi:MAG: carboxypeptidase regulatory-like domain-containing protein [Flavobacteriales bacterium]|nr:carboxypeptidase regulatory-like domain-containing protein [Flavobacteriales bacterium]
MAMCSLCWVRWSVLGFVLSLFPGVSQAQDTLVVVFGMVKDITTKEPLQDVQVDAIDLKYGRRVMATLFQGGHYELDFVQEADYMVEYSAEGYVPKRVRLQLIGLTPEEWEGGYGMEVDVTLFRDLPELDLTLGGDPMGICRFNHDSLSFEWDLAHTEGKREQMARMLKAYEKLIGETR